MRWSAQSANSPIQIPALVTVGSRHRRRLPRDFSPSVRAGRGRNWELAVQRAANSTHLAAGPVTGIVSRSDGRLAHSPGNLHASKHCPMTGLLVYKQTLNGSWMELKSDSIEPNASTPSRSPYAAFRQQLSPALSLSLFTRSRRNGKGDAVCSRVFLPPAASAICPDLPE